jgi:hypothetical protein
MYHKLFPTPKTDKGNKMRQLHTLLGVMLFFITGIVFGQWENKSIGIHYNDGNVGIGIMKSSALLNVGGDNYQLIRLQRGTGGNYNVEKKVYLTILASFKSPMQLQLADHLNQLNTSFSENKRRERPPLSGVRIAGELLAGAGTGVLSGYITHKIVGDYEKNSPEDSGGFGQIFIFISGFSLGTHIGIYLVGTMGNETGSYFVTLTGSILGLLGGAFLTPVTYGISLLILPLIGPVYAFNLTREYNSPPLFKTTMIDFRSGNMSLHIPEIYFQLSPSDGRSLIPTVHLINAEF